jgi:hypothetical protein
LSNHFCVNCKVIIWCLFNVTFFCQHFMYCISPVPTKHNS